MQNQDCVIDFAIGITPRPAKSGVVQLEFRQRFATLEMEIVNNEVAFFLLEGVRDCRRILRDDVLCCESNVTEQRDDQDLLRTKFLHFSESREAFSSYASPSFWKKLMM